MPLPRKCFNSAVDMKKKRMIDNRLLEISILVEDYIYENKPIRRHEAEMYAKEVASYVDKCFGDERSLQVIEKLRRHMRNIIAEQSELVDEGNFAQPLPSTTPVYQILDDDIIMTPSGQDIEVEDFTQEFKSPIGAEEHVEKSRKERIAMVKRNTRDNSGLDDDLTQCTQDIEVEDLTQEFNSLNREKKPVEIGRKKRKANIKHNIRDNSGLDDDLTQCTQDTDININIHNIKTQNSFRRTNTRAGNKRNVTVKRNIRREKDKRNVSNNYSSYLDVIDLCDDNCIRVEEKQQDSISSLYIRNDEVTNTPSDLSVCSPSILNSFYPVPGIPKPNTQELFEKLNPGGIVVNTNNTVKNVDKFTKRENIELVTKRNIPEEDILPLPNKANATEKINNMKINKINTEIININKLNSSNTINAQKPSVILSETPKNKVNGALNNKFKKPSINSEKVINDLSWIENIRFVREIAKEEYEHCSVPDMFWDNYMLPENWNDDDFLYT